MRYNRTLTESVKAYQNTSVYISQLIFLHVLMNVHKVYTYCSYMIYLPPVHIVSSCYSPYYEWHTTLMTIFVCIRIML